MPALFSPVNYTVLGTFLYCCLFVGCADDVNLCLFVCCYHSAVGR